MRHIRNSRISDHRWRHSFRLFAAHARVSSMSFVSLILSSESAKSLRSSLLRRNTGVLGCSKIDEYVGSGTTGISQSRECTYDLRKHSIWNIHENDGWKSQAKEVTRRYDFKYINQVKLFKAQQLMIFGDGSFRTSIVRIVRGAASARDTPVMRSCAWYTLRFRKTLIHLTCSKKLPIDFYLDVKDPSERDFWLSGPKLCAELENEACSASTRVRESYFEKQKLQNVLSAVTAEKSIGSKMYHFWGCGYGMDNSIYCQKIVIYFCKF